MPRRLTLLTFIGIALAAINMGDDGCEDWDQESQCNASCSKLVDCENEWLVDDGEAEMEGTEYLDYLKDCTTDCNTNGDEEEIECIQNSSCDALLDGECAD